MSFQMPSITFVKQETFSKSHMAINQESCDAYGNFSLKLKPYMKSRSEWCMFLPKAMMKKKKQEKLQLRKFLSSRHCLLHNFQFILKIDLHFNLCCVSFLIFFISVLIESIGNLKFVVFAIHTKTLSESSNCVFLFTPERIVCRHFNLLKKLLLIFKKPYDIWWVLIWLTDFRISWLLNLGWFRKYKGINNFNKNPNKRSWNRFNSCSIN